MLSAAAPPEPPASAPEPVQPVAAAGCPATSANQYTLIPVTGPPTDHPDALHGDLNLGLRGYTPTDAAAALISINGPTDSDPPQISSTLLGGGASFTQVYRVRDWDWGCGEHGCQGGELSQVEASLLGIAAAPGQPLSFPARSAQIYGGGYTALVVYAEETRLTVVYTREDSVANGYTAHLEKICVDPNLLALYRSANAAGRGSLPGLRNGDVVGTASGGEIAVAVRDRGWFSDPRSAKDWWHTGQ